MSARLKMVLSMAIFSTIGVLRRWIDLPSGMLAMLRGIIGMLFLLLVLCMRRQRMDMVAIRRSLSRLCVSGAMMGVNWILLFEAYSYTSVATATLCYYLAPMFVILASTFLFRERLGLKKGICVIAAFIGMVLVSGAFETGFAGFKGIALSLGAAVLYASVVLMNKGLQGVNAFDRTIVQLAASSVALLPYVLLAESLAGIQLHITGMALVLTAGIVHTGVAYALYFGALKDIPAQTAALLSYIDPVGAVLLSALLLREDMSAPAIIGAVLVLGAAAVSELPARKKAS